MLFYSEAQGLGCPNDEKSFSIKHNGSVAFRVSDEDLACSCAGALLSLSGMSRMVNLTVDNLFVGNSVGGGVGDGASSAEVSELRLTVQQLNETVAVLQHQLAALISAGGANAGSNCVVVPPVNGRAVNDPVRIADTGLVAFACNAGYTLSGQANQKCLSGAFNYQLPVCNPSSCTASAPVSGSASPTNVAHGGTVTYACNTGYTLSGQANQTCVRGAFSDALPVCNPNGCVATAPVNGSASLTTVAHGGTVTYACDSGFTLSGQATQTCSAGAFNYALPLCNPSSCSTVAPTDGSRSPTTVAHGGTVTYSCNSGFALNGSTTRTCLFGALDGTMPQCVGAPCTASAPTYGSVTLTDIPHRQNVTYSCQASYAVTSYPIRTCTNGVLSGTAPTCVAISTCTSNGLVKAFNTFTKASTGCFPSTLVCGRRYYPSSWDGGNSFRVAGEWISCTAAGAQCVAGVGITTYNTTSCQGAWDFFCDSSFIGRIDTSGKTTCAGDATANGCTALLSQGRTCTVIKAVAVSSSSVCCGSTGTQGPIDSAITGLVAW
eukprot:TRINITY_DN3568_c0_g2_i1.p1 TRINITY_DN3568_c0_g2~~TRINITY_DN3568_c0_g2_i1.p1  ORF type:complete len:567 (+),score=93.55 TRINITY_DN3568_c0_g2_i1:58-1701(+)